MVTVIKHRDDYNDTRFVELMIDSEDEVEELPTDVAPGSFATTNDLSAVYRFGSNGKWKKVGD